MATWNRLIICSKWTVINGAQVPMGVNALAAGESWQDVTGQQPDASGNAITDPNLFIIEVFCGEASRGLLDGSLNHLLLARQAWDTATPETLLVNNFDNTVTLAQATTFKTELQSRFGLDVTHIQEQGVDLIQEGITRKQLIKRLVDKWVGFLKATG